MGIYDRDYVNDKRGMGSHNHPSSSGGLFARSPGWSVTTWLIVINVVVYMLMMSVLPIIFDLGSLSLATAFSRLEVWRLITFQFLHSPSSFSHILFNMLGLWIFGPMVERYLGRKKYLAYYLVCGLFGGLLFIILNLLGNQLNIQLPMLLTYDPASPLVGASAGVFGVIVACAYISPNTEVMLLFPPIPMKMRTFAYGYVAFALFNLLRGASNAGGEAAHIGGAIAGYIFIRNTHLLTDFFDVFGDSRKSKPKKQSTYRNYKNTSGPHPDEVDRILRKVSQKGLASLSEKEKKTLSQASRDDQ